MAARNPMESPREGGQEYLLAHAPESPEAYKELKKQVAIWEALYADRTTKNQGHAELVKKLEESIQKGNALLDQYEKAQGVE